MFLCGSFSGPLRLCQGSEIREVRSEEVDVFGRCVRGVIGLIIAIIIIIIIIITIITIIIMIVFIIGSISIGIIIDVITATPELAFQASGGGTPPPRAEIQIRKAFVALAGAPRGQFVSKLFIARPPDHIFGCPSIPIPPSLEGRGRGWGGLAPYLVRAPPSSESACEQRADATQRRCWELWRAALARVSPLSPPRTWPRKTALPPDRPYFYMSDRREMSSH